ncbi:DUF6719 family protein [Sinorhizobium fredii]|uniref:DUF6719 family protein n=1 Tax=Rhizobium fredii TaxID=380 RepID=UPI00351609B9
MPRKSSSISLSGIWIVDGPMSRRNALSPMGLHFFFCAVKAHGLSTRGSQNPNVALSSFFTPAGLKNAPFLVFAALRLPPSAAPKRRRSGLTIVIGRSSFIPQMRDAVESSVVQIRRTDTILSARMEREMNSAKLLAIGVVALATSACTQTLTAEPGPGTLASGAKVIVDDGSCPEGQIKQVTGGNNALGISRKRECVARPS